MGSVHVPWLAGSRRAGPRWARMGRLVRLGRLGHLALAVAVVVGLTLVSGAHDMASAATDAPYGGTAAAVPGTVYAANYDTGGQGVAYNVTSTNGTANSYRSDGVDLEATADTQNTSGGGKYDIGWTAAGQWFNYTVNVATAGTYSVAFRVASPYGITDALHIANASGTNLSGAVAVPNTGGYQTWTTVTASVTLPAGQQTLRIDQDSNGWNLHFITFTLTSGSGGGSGGDQPYGGTAAAVPGTVQAENYDTGGQGVAYNVTSTNGSANSYRSDGVDLEATTDTGGGYDLGWTAAGQWFKYTVNVATAGTYTVGLRLAAPTAVTDGLHIANSAGTNLSGDVTAPATGGYQTWTTVSVTVTLSAGVQTLTVDQDHAGWNINYLTFATTSGGGGGTGYGGFPASFWGNTSSIPSTSGAIEFDFINATNGAYPDSEVYWDVNGVEESIAQSPYYSMASCNSCRIYFYLGSPSSQYQRLHRAELQRHDDQRRHLARRRVRAAAGDPPAQLQRHRHRGRGGRPGVLREQDRPVPAVRERGARRVPATRHRGCALQHPRAWRCRGLPARRSGRQLHDLVRGLGGSHRDHAGGLRVPGRRNPGPQR